MRTSLCSTIICGKEIVSPELGADFPPNKYKLVGKLCHICVIATDEMQNLSLQDYSSKLKPIATVMHTLRTYEIPYESVGIHSPQPSSNHQTEHPLVPKPNTYPPCLFLLQSQSANSALVHVHMLYSIRKIYFIISTICDIILDQYVAKPE